MNILRLIISVIFIFIASRFMGQSIDNLDNLFNKKWTIKFYETGGHKAPASGPETDYSVFKPDNTQKSISNGTVLTSKWKFDSASSTLTLYSDDDKSVTTEMKIISLTEDTFVSEIKMHDGLLRIHMSSRP